MHPLIMESIAEQRLEDLRADRHPVTDDCPRRGPGRARSHSPHGPMGRAEARIGAWMVTTGSRLVRNGTGSGGQHRPFRRITQGRRCDNGTRSAICAHAKGSKPQARSGPRSPRRH